MKDMAAGEADEKLRVCNGEVEELEFCSCYAAFTHEAVPKLRAG